MKRRIFLKRSAIVATGMGSVQAGLAAILSGCAPDAETQNAAPERATQSNSPDDQSSSDAPLFALSLAEWSLHRMLQDGTITNLDFPILARNQFGIGALEYVNSFFKDKARDIPYLTELKTRCDGEGVASSLIMCDGEGALGDAEEKKRTTAVENHYRWIEAAQFLGCHTIRVNAQSAGSWDEQRDRAADGLRRLTEFGADHSIDVIVENHGGLSSNGKWLTSVIQQVDHPRCGTLPDFGNFNLGDGTSYDRYLGVKEMMPYAKAVSAKSYGFSEDGSETTIDYLQMMAIVLDAGYRGNLGVEYEGDQFSEADGILATKALLEYCRRELGSRYV